jgi:hypothetical protein
MGFNSGLKGLNLKNVSLPQNETSYEIPLLG